MAAVPLLVPLTVKPTVLAAVGVIVLIAVEPGTWTIAPPLVAVPSKNVPDASGNVYVRAAVRSELVIVPSKRAAPPAVTLTAIRSSVDVAVSTVAPRRIEAPVTLSVDPIVVAPPLVTLKLAEVTVRVLAPVLKVLAAPAVRLSAPAEVRASIRSEERRVGKEC